jgi:hypothetical protein
MVNMKKQDVIDSLAIFVLSDKCSFRGQKEFALFLMQYLKKNTMPGDDFDFMMIDHYFHKIILDAVVFFRTSDEPYVVDLRDEYKRETGHSVPDPTGFGSDSNSFVQINMEFIIGAVFEDREDHGQYIIANMNALCKAHWHYLDQVFRCFIRDVWRKGVCELIKNATLKGVKGVFGDVTLLTYTICGRTAVQFDKADGSSVSYMVEENDLMAYSAGINFCETDLHTACNMIQTVISNWPNDKAEQELVFFPDKKVKNIAVAVLEASNRV